MQSYNNTKISKKVCKYVFAQIITFLKCIFFRGKFIFCNLFNFFFYLHFWFYNLLIIFYSILYLICIWGLQNVSQRVYLGSFPKCIINFAFRVFITKSKFESTKQQYIVTMFLLSSWFRIRNLVRTRVCNQFTIFRYNK